MKTIHHRKPAPGKPTYLKVRFTVLDDPPRLTFEVLEQDEKLRGVGQITAGVKSISCPQLDVFCEKFFCAYLRGDNQSDDKFIDSVLFSSVAKRDACLARAQQALIDAEPRIMKQIECWKCTQCGWSMTK